jgi:ADP-ribosylation factor related protein 1
MFTLLSGFYKYVTQKDEYFILILGLDNSGKSTYLEQVKTKFTANYRMMNPAKITTTVGCNIGKVDIGNVRLNFWDLGGQEELQSLWDKYYAECHGIIYMIDSTDRVRLDESWQAFHKMIQNEQLIGLPLLVACNKQDLDDCLTVAEIKKQFNKSATQIGVRNCMATATSALTGDGVHEGINWMKECVESNSSNRMPKESNAA